MWEETLHMFNVMYTLLALQAWFVLHVTFVVVRSSKMACWSKLGPRLSWFLTHLGFIIVPVINIGYFVWNWVYGDIMDEKDILRPWFLTFFFISIFEILGYFFLGRILVDVVNATLDAEVEDERIRLEKLDEDELDEDAGFEFTDLCYGEAERDVGSGPYRIGEPLKDKISNDLYGMIYACCFRAEYVLHFKRKEDAKGDLDDKVINQFKAKKLKEKVPYGVQVRADKPIVLPPTKAEIRQQHMDEMQ